MNLKDKTVLVTGSSSGIGQAIAIECAKKGVVVLIHYRKNKTGAEKTRKQVEKYSRGQIFQADLSKPEEVGKMFAQIGKHTPTIDALVNNAGEYGSGEFTDLKQWQLLFGSNFFSAVHSSNEFLRFPAPGLRKIVNISSVYGLAETASTDGPQYSAAKAAINSLTVTLAKKFAPDVLVNAVAPGYTWTPNWEGMSEAELKRFSRLTRIKRLVKTEEIATMVVAVLENDAVTGEVIRVDGGLHLADVL